MDYCSFSATKEQQQSTNNPEGMDDANYKDWVFINYTYKRFEGLTQRGRPQFS